MHISNLEMKCGCGIVFHCLNFQATRVNPTHYRLHQKRYLIDSDQGNEDEEEHNPLGYKWDIPLTWFSDKGSKKVEQKWLLSSDGYVDVKVDATATFVKFNVGQFGFYRVNYPKEEWIKFSKVLQEDHAQFSEQISFHVVASMVIITPIPTCSGRHNGPSTSSERCLCPR